MNGSIVLIVLPMTKEDPAGPRGRLYPEKVDCGIEDDKPNDPRPFRNGTHSGAHRRGTDDITQGRDKQTIQENGPTGEKSGHTVKAASRVGIDGSSHRKCL